MKKLHASIVIHAPKVHVWHTMLDDTPYREWTTAFNPGSYYKGDWSKGSKILFLGPNPGAEGEAGMVSRISENIPYEFVSIEHLGIVANGVEDTTSEEARKWSPAFENYTLKTVAGGTEVVVDMDIQDAYHDEFTAMWNRGLALLKTIAERAITVETIVHAPIEKVWECWTDPAHITKWAFASDDWEAPAAENDVHTGGKFKTVMAAKDKSASFDFTGTYTDVREHEVIAYDMEDGRHVTITFEQVPEGVKVTETFDPENENAAEMQRAGWQAIMDNFKRYVETE